MLRVWKFELPIIARPIAIRLAEHAELLSVQVQEGNPRLWALVSDDAPLETRTFIWRATGQEFEDEGHIYVGTVQLPPFVYHLFETP